MTIGLEDSQDGSAFQQMTGPELQDGLEPIFKPCAQEKDNMFQAKGTAICYFGLVTAQRANHTLSV